MIGAEDGNALIFVKLAAQTADTGGGVEQGFRGISAQAADIFRLQDTQLPVEKMAAVGNFVIGGVAVAGRAAFEDVENVNIFAAQGAFCDNFVEQLAGFTNEWFASTVFIGTGCLASKDETG